MGKRGLTPLLCFFFLTPPVFDGFLTLLLKGFITLFWCFFHTPFLGGCKTLLGEVLTPILCFLNIFVVFNTLFVFLTLFWVFYTFLGGGGEFNNFF